VLSGDVLTQWRVSGFVESESRQLVGRHREVVDSGEDADDASLGASTFAWCGIEQPSFEYVGRHVGGSHAAETLHDEERRAERDGSGLEPRDVWDRDPRAIPNKSHRADLSFEVIRPEDRERVGRWRHAQDVLASMRLVGDGEEQRVAREPGAGGATVQPQYRRPVRAQLALEPARQRRHDGRLVTCGGRWSIGHRAGPREPPRSLAVLMVLPRFAS
jgi:hypothetical protein